MRVWISKVLQNWAAKMHASRIERLEQENGDLRSALAAERDKTRQLAEVQRSNAEHIKRIAELERQLTDTETDLRVAQTENRLLSEVHEADISRRKRERAIYDRDRAQATAATPGGEESEE